MFEYDQDIVEELLTSDETFKRLFEKHHELKQKVRDANVGALPLDDYSLENLKKEKLHLKDQMASIIARHRDVQQMRA